ncbi:MAG: RNA polymerase sigma factor [Planctomycetes bacterium]|nr:RNA polymerase sigma factor [Planctomycetota bacterium]
MNSAEPSTQSLVAGAQAGDAAAREQLFRRYLPRVARMVAVQLGVRRDQLPAEAEDIAQDAIVKALRALPVFEVRGKGAFTAWLATIVENCIRSHARTAHNGVARQFWQRYGDLDLTESFFAGQETSPSRCAADHEANRRVEAAMLELPQLYRRVLSLRFLAGMSHADLAQAIGRTETNCRKLVQRAVESLRALLAGQKPG